MLQQLFRESVTRVCTTRCGAATAAAHAGATGRVLRCICHPGVQAFDVFAGEDICTPVVVPASVVFQNNANFFGQVREQIEDCQKVSWRRNVASFPVSPRGVFQPAASFRRMGFQARPKDNARAWKPMRRPPRPAQPPVILHLHLLSSILPLLSSILNPLASAVSAVSFSPPLHGKMPTISRPSPYEGPVLE